MMNNKYIRIKPYLCGGLVDGEFHLSAWFGDGLFAEGGLRYATKLLAKAVCEMGLAEDIASWPVLAPCDLAEFYKCKPPAEITQIEVAHSIYQSNLAYSQSAYYMTEEVYNELVIIEPGIKGEIATPLFFKCLTIENHLKIGQWNETESHWNMASGLPLVSTSHVNHADCFGFTPLHEAVSANYCDGIEHLLSAGADLYSKTLHGLDVFDIALRFDHSETLNFLISRNSASDTQAIIHKCINSNAPECIKSLLPQLPEPDCRDNNQQDTLLMKAIQWKDIDLTRSLLELGADVNICRLGLSEETPLSLAIKSHDPAIVKLLLDSGANPNQQISSRTGRYPFQAAFATGVPDEILIQLLNAGLDPHLKKSNGKTFLEHRKSRRINGPDQIRKIKLVEVALRGKRT